MTATIDAIRPVLKSQYHASLAMLREAVQRCPEDVWLSNDHKNAFWQVAYHALFFAHLYLGPDEAAFRPWKHHQGTAEDPDGTAGRAYTKEQVLEYCEFCSERPRRPELFHHAAAVAIWQQRTGDRIRPEFHGHNFFILGGAQWDAIVDWQFRCDTELTRSNRQCIAQGGLRDCFRWR